MIARIWKGTTQAGKADEYADYLAKTGVKDLNGTPGNRGVLVLRQVQGGDAFFTLISFWDSMDSIRLFAGDNPEKARYYPEDSQYLQILEPHVEHFEVVTDSRPGKE